MNIKESPCCPDRLGSAGCFDIHCPQQNERLQAGRNKADSIAGMNNEAVDVSSIRAMVMEDFYKNSEQRLQEQKEKINSTGRQPPTI